MRGFIVIAALAIGFAAPPLAAGPMAVAPAAKAFPLGAVEVVALRDALNIVPNDGSVFGTNANPGSVAEVLHRAGAPEDKVTLGVDALLVKSGDRIVLLDSGLGPTVNGMLTASLAAAKVMPDQVTDIFITHSHFDHVGGLMTATGKSVFPKSAIHFSSAEWAWLKGNPKNARLVAAIGAQVKTFEPGTEPVPGILAIAATGHTPGHTMYEISSRGQKLLDIGDSAHSAIISLARPDWTIGYDTDAKQGAASRETILARVAASHELVFAPHFPFPGIGHVVGKDGHYSWQPLP
jgi:glyoxylase-like metal-dependent hydrolase (beta-lactamase superfamily II)